MYVCVDVCVCVCVCVDVFVLSLVSSSSPLDPQKEALLSLLLPELGGREHTLVMAAVDVLCGLVSLHGYLTTQEVNFWEKVCVGVCVLICSTIGLMILGGSVYCTCTCTCIYNVHAVFLTG